MNWTVSSMENTIVLSAELEEIRERYWEELNDPDYVSYKKGMRVSL